jgi:hypothetical protein
MCRSVPPYHGTIRQHHPGTEPTTGRYDYVFLGAEMGICRCQGDALTLSRADRPDITVEVRCLRVETFNWHAFVAVNLGLEF